MPPSVARVGDSNTPQNWWAELPVITKSLLAATLLSTAATTFNLTTPANFALIWPLVKEKFQIWRLVGCFIYAGPFRFQYFIHMLMLYQNSSRYEADPFNTGGGGSSADYVFLLLFAMTCFLLISLVFYMPFLAEPLLFTIMYSACRRSPDAITSFFGLKFKNLYVPWVNVAYRLLIGDGVLPALIGIAVGHVYYFLVEVVPATHGKTLLTTPNFCFSLVEYLSGRSVGRAPATSAYVPPARAAAAASASSSSQPSRPTGASTGYNWGSGRTLGTRDA